jgi:branched-chain amino acid transport system permease protein
MNSPLPSIHSPGPVTFEQTGASPWRRAAWVVGGIAVLVPFALGDYQAFQFAQLAVLAIALLGLNVLTGYTGQISLGHGAFFALGAYFCVALMEQGGVPYWVAIPVSALMCFVCGLLFGWPALRMEGPYLALITFALAVAVPALLKHDALSAWTGGVQGISIDRQAPPAFWTFGADHWLYFVCLVWAGLLFSAVNNLVDSRVGRALVAIRESGVAASTMGINRPVYAAVAFGISAFITGVAGALSALAAQYVSPDSFPPFLSISFLVGLVVGGVARPAGPLVGAVFLYAMPKVAEGISKGAPWAIYGITLLIVVYLMPTGLAGVFDRFKR